MFCWVARPSFVLPSMITMLFFVVTGCSHKDEGTTPLVGVVGGRPPSPGEIPEKSEVSGQKMTTGFAFGKVRNSEQVATFSIARFPVTQTQYQTCVAAGACSVVNNENTHCQTSAMGTDSQKSRTCLPTESGLPGWCMKRAMCPRFPAESSMFS
jgi:hypothetical protein